MSVAEPMLEALIASWEPKSQAVSCANCSRTMVFGKPEDPAVTCTAGHGYKTIPLVRLIRPTYRRGFASAEKCLDFEEMG